MISQKPFDVNTNYIFLYIKIQRIGLTHLLFSLTEYSITNPPADVRAIEIIIYSNIGGYIASAYDGKRNMSSENARKSAISGKIIQPRHTVSKRTVGSDGKNAANFLFLFAFTFFLFISRHAA